MRAFHWMAAIAVAIALSFAGAGVTASADNIQPNMTVALNVDIQQGGEPVKKLDFLLPRVAQAACGLCTDEDCCGGTENGWKLCQSDCPSGQYKCMQVATCP